MSHVSIRFFVPMPVRAGQPGCQNLLRFKDKLGECGRNPNPRPMTKSDETRSRTKFDNCRQIPCSVLRILCSSHSFPCYPEQGTMQKPAAAQRFLLRRPVSAASKLSISLLNSLFAGNYVGRRVRSALCPQPALRRCCERGTHNPWHRLYSGATWVSPFLCHGSRRAALPRSSP